VKRIHKFLKLSWRDQLLLIHATFVLATVVLGLRVFPLLILQRPLLKLANWYSRFAWEQRPSAQHIARAMRIASSYVPKAACLPRALATQLLLIQNAHPAKLQIGVTRSEDRKLEAHAWVTSGRDIIIGGVDDINHFVPLSRMKREDIVDYAKTG
jgi:hypothetical protein